MKNFVITIARGFGSGGRQIAAMLADELHIHSYNNRILTLASQYSGYPEHYFKEADETLHGSLIAKQLLELPKMFHTKGHLSRFVSDDQLFEAQKTIIRKLADTESCVIVGKCADYILKDYPHLIKVFCYSDAASALKRCTEEYGISKETAESEIKRINRSRVAHYEYYTGQKWGEPHQYNLMINTGSMPLDVACGLIKDLYLRMQKAEPA